MTNIIGSPKSQGPSWYRNRPPSYIEGEFTNELGQFADLIESEKWFGDKDKHFRYRVDFILMDARLIIELDGHDYHSSKEQLKNDAKRQRYLTRAGYTIIRYTGSEIHEDCAACVEEVRDIYKERMQRTPGKYRVMYIDYPFVCKVTQHLLRFQKQLQAEGHVPVRDVTPVSLDELLPHAIEWLYEKSHIAAIVFYPPEFESDIEHLDGKIKEYEKGEIVISLVKDELYSFELGDHMMRFSHLFDEFMLVGDDVIYIDPLRSVLPSELTKYKNGNHEYKYLANAKLLRLGNYETNYADSELAYIRWQQLYYVIGASMGIPLHDI
ncbi:TPA: endonuclease domain-containing protein [Providencia stuartii]